MFWRRLQHREETSPPPFAAAETNADPSRLDHALATLEAAALAAYARFGLPDRPGCYSRAPDATAWTFLADTLSPEDKWALLERQPLGEGWRYAELASLGADSPVAEVRAASRILLGCAALRWRSLEAERLDADDLADAVRLGALWGWIAPTSDTLIEPA